MSANPSPPALRLACERLALSRQRLQQALSAEPATLAEATKECLEEPAADWLDGLKSIPGFGLAIEVAKAWCARHPYRLMALAVRDVANAAVLPTARCHPFGLVVGAFAVGGLLAWSRPWRWFPLKAVLSIAAQSER